MTHRTLRLAAIMLATLLAALALAAPAAAQDGTPAASPEGGQPIMVGATEVTWTGDWQHDEASSLENQQVTLAQIDTDARLVRIATYGEFEDETVDSPAAALDTFADAFFDNTDVGMVVEAGMGELEDGAVWKLFTFDLQGTNLAFLVTVSETPEGAYVVSTATANLERFQEAVELAQAEILLNGEPIFLDGVDAAAVAAGLTATPVASPAT